MLTTLTTVGGLLPILLETSLQAQILIPRATSVAFGEIFATLIVLVLVPVAYSLGASLSPHGNQQQERVGTYQAAGGPPQLVDESGGQLSRA